MNNIRFKIKKIIPFWILKLRRLFIRNVLMDNLNITGNKVRLLLKKNKKLRLGDNILTVLFIVQRTEVFNSEKTIFEAFANDETCRTYILPLPRTNIGESLPSSENYNSVVEFYRKLKGGIVVESYDKVSGKYFDIKNILPDYIFIDVPYTTLFPKEYSIDRLAQLSKVCYVPYGFAFSNEKKCRNMYNSSLNIELLSYVSFFFSDGEVTTSLCKKKLFLSEIFFNKNLYDVGFPRFDNIIYNTKIAPPCCFLWLPRWTADDAYKKGNLGTNFFKYKNQLNDFFRRNPKLQLVIRPHPLAFSNFIFTGLMTEKDVDDYKKSITKEINIELDELDNYEYSLNKADVLIADFSSIIIEFFITGKPIVYCGCKNDFSVKLSYITDTFYYVDNWEQLEDTILQLKTGIDPLKEKRVRAIKCFLKGKEGAGQRIKELLVDDWKNSKR